MLLEVGMDLLINFYLLLQNNYNFWGQNGKKQIRSLSAGVDENLKNLKYIPFNNIEISKKS